MILVTGGTGMLGAHVLLACAKRNKQIRATYRRAESLDYTKELFKKLFAENSDSFKLIEWIKTDINDLIRLDAAFEGVEYVYHCAAKVSLLQFHEEKLLKTNIEGTANIVNLCIKHKVKKLGYVSSIASLGVEKNVKVVNENHSWSSGQNHTSYAFSKYKAELEVWRGSQEGLDMVIINPGLILGAHFWHHSSVAIFQKQNNGLKYYAIGNTPIVALKDVVKSLILLMDSPIKNERFILVAENLKQKILFDKIAIEMNKKKPTFPLSKGILYALFVIDKTLNFLGLRKSYMSLSLIDSLCNDQEYDGSKILSKVNFTYSKTDEVISQIVKTY